jgi:hypothetical protein
MKPDGIHGLRIAGELLGMILTPSDAVVLSQKLQPVKSTDRAEIVPLAVTERKAGTDRKGGRR